MRLVASWATDVGRVRSGNEDSYLVDDVLGLFAVADGMGGHAAGEIASGTAVEALRAAVARGLSITDAVVDANNAVFERARRDPSLRGMGTTLTATVPLGGRHLEIGQVGDSRAYLIRNGTMERVTRDHSIVDELVRSGRITADEAAEHPQRNIVTRALGIDPDVEVDTYTLEVADGDRLLLCSDGLTSMVRDPDIADIATGSDPSATIVEHLVDLALERGGDDNVTVVIIDIDETSDDEPFEAIGASGAKAEHASAVSAPDDVPSAPTVASDLDTPTRKPGRALLWLVATLVPIAVLVVGAWLGLRYWNDHQFYVGVHNGNLALFRGSADSPFGWEPNVVVEATDVRVSRITDEAQRTAIEHGRACKTSDETKARTCFADQRERALNPPAMTSP